MAATLIAKMQPTGTKQHVIRTQSGYGKCNSEEDISFVLLVLVRQVGESFANFRNLFLLYVTHFVEQLEQQWKRSRLPHYRNCRQVLGLPNREVVLKPQTPTALATTETEYHTIQFDAYWYLARHIAEPLIDALDHV
jgi:hypothetical protein